MKRLYAGSRYSTSQPIVAVRAKEKTRFEKRGAASTHIFAGEVTRIRGGKRKVLRHA